MQAKNERYFHHKFAQWLDDKYDDCEPAWDEIMTEDEDHDYFDHPYSQGLRNSQDLAGINISDDETVLPSPVLSLSSSPLSPILFD